MDREQVLKRYRSEDRNLLWPGEELEQLPCVTRRSAILGDLNTVTACALTAENADQEIVEQITHFKKRYQVFEWKVFSFDEPPDLIDRLARLGFSIGKEEALVVLDTETSYLDFQAMIQTEVRLVRSQSEIEDFRRVAESVFQKDFSLTAVQLTQAIANGDRSHQGFVAYSAGEPVSVGRLYCQSRSAFAGFYGGGTLAEFRGMGFYRAIVAARAIEAIALGARYLQVDALPTSLPILERLGFIQLAKTLGCCLDPC